MPSFLARFYDRIEPPDPSVWHRWNTFWPVRTIEGSLDTRVWRRWRDGWEYSSRPETEEEFASAQW